MNTHYQEQIPLYAAGQLNAEDQAELEKHLRGCADCQAELNFWRDVAAAITATDASRPAPRDLAERAIRRLHAPSSLRRAFLRASSLLRAQAYLVKGEMWPASAAVMALGVIVALLSDQAGVITFIAPLIAAASLAVIYGPENDPASELTVATPMSPWKILLARLTLVSGYNLLLALAASLALLSIMPADLLGSIILGWLGPLTFLSALALLLSLWIGVSNAITLAYGLWIAQYIWPSHILGNPSNLLLEVCLTGYRRFWQSPALLFPLTIVVVCLALLSTRRSEQILSPRSMNLF